ncbi:MAG: hypothetical protein HRF52_06960 [Ignavibacterium sp.]|jgi:hypothetical protein|uniref:hypothetical protein n=1 Tax=Ignavibacterium sp. TaxID=2651167 RepID=UPI003296DF4A
MKILSWLIIILLSFNFYFINAQVDSSIKTNHLISDFPIYDIINKCGFQSITVQDHLFISYESKDLIINLFQKLYIPEYFFNNDKLLIEKNKNYSIDFSRMIPKGNPTFSIQYALFYGLYSDNKYSLKRWDCID